MMMNTIGFGEIDASTTCRLLSHFRGNDIWLAACDSDALQRVGNHTRRYSDESPLADALKITSRLIRAGLTTQVYVIHA